VRYPEDRYGDVIGQTDEVFKNAIETYFKLNPILLYEHGLDQVIGNKPLGQVIDYRFDDYGLWVKAYVMKPVWEPMIEVYRKIKAGILRTFSIGGLWAYQSNEIVRADLVEISVVATPAQPYAVFDLASKSFGAKAKGDKDKAGNKILSVVEVIRVKKYLAEANVEYWTLHSKRILHLPVENFKSEKAYRASLWFCAKRLEQSLAYSASLNKELVKELVKAE
jgi:phage head maturation protease